MKLWVCMGVLVGVVVVVGVGVGVWIGSWLGVGFGVVIGSCGSLVVVSSLGVGVGSCVGVGSLDVGSWLGIGSLGSSSLGIGVVSGLGVGASLGVGADVVFTSCVGWLSLGSSWLDVVAHATRANAIAPTIDRASILLIIFCLITHTPLDKFRFAIYTLQLYRVSNVKSRANCNVYVAKMRVST